MTIGRYVVAQGRPGAQTYVELEDGRRAIVSGSRSWRNNNPGNLMHIYRESRGETWRDSWATRNGAIGDDEGYAVFPTFRDGLLAMRTLLLRKWGSYFFPAMIREYAPAGHGGNDPDAYIETVRAAGVPDNIPISNLNKEQLGELQKAMIAQEGLHGGSVRWLEAKDPKGRIETTAARGSLLFIIIVLALVSVGR